MKQDVKEFFKENIDWSKLVARDENLYFKYPHFLFKNGNIKKTNVQKELNKQKLCYFNYLKYFLAKYQLASSLGTIVNLGEFSEEIPKNIFQYNLLKTEYQKKINSYIEEKINFYHEHYSFSEKNYLIYLIQKGVTNTEHLKQYDNYADFLLVDKTKVNSIVLHENYLIKKKYVSINKISKDIKDYSNKLIKNKHNKIDLFNKVLNRIVMHFEEMSGEEIFETITNNIYRIQNNNKSNFMFLKNPEIAFDGKKISFNDKLFCRIKFDSQAYKSPLRLEFHLRRI